MRRAIVHIGLPRTGTTSFQRLLDLRRAELARIGILYPDLTPASATERHLSHQHLGEALDGRRPPRERDLLLGLLEDQLADAEVVLLSYEGLCLMPLWRFGPRRLAQLFARHGFAMEVLATVKPQAELLNSTYTWRMQFLREGRSFDDFFRGELASRKIDMARLIGRWLPAAEGRATLVPVRDRASDAPLVPRIWRALELDRVVPLFSDGELAVRENASPGPLAIAVDRRLYRLGTHRRLGVRTREATRLVELLAREAGHDAARFNGLDPVRRVRAEAYWRPANDRLAQRVWGTSWADRVAEETPAPVNELSAEEAGGETADAIVAEVLRRLD